MKKITVLLLILAVCSGCSPFKEIKRSNEPNLLTAANQVSLNKEINRFTTQSWIPGGLPVPMDHLMLTVVNAAKKSEKQGKIVFHIPDHSSLIAEFNAYAAEKILSGKGFIPQRERHQFILKRCGKDAGPYIIEYFRVLERKSLHIITTAGVTNGTNLKVFDFYKISDLDEYQSYLEQAEKAACGTPFEQTISRELKFFLTCRKTIETALKNSFPQLYPESGTSIVLNTLRGAAPKRKTVVKCEYSADQTALILKMEAEEPQMNLRKITQTYRDYPMAWKDDRFEIFIVPDPEKISDYIQFIITSGGVLWDGKRVMKGFPERSWNSKAKWNVTRFSDRWTAELIIPLSDLGFHKKPSGISRFNIFRFREIKGSKTEGFALAPILSGQNFQPERFGKIIWNKGEQK